jgi:dolichol-phosphate mannosyltransferase
VSSKRILVTGASGFVGANLVRRALQDGHEVRLLVRANYQSWRVQEIASHVRFHTMELTDRQGMKALLNEVRPDWVFHLAAYGAYSNQRGIEQIMATNVLGCAALLDASVETGVEAFVNTGSSSEYGIKDHPAQEEETVEPNSYYAISKVAATHLCQFTARKLDVNVISVRLYSIYGPYEEPSRLIPTLIVRGMQGSLPPLVSPQIARDFVFVDDAVEAILTIAATPVIPRGSVYNICSGRQVTLREAVDTACRLMDVKVAPSWETMPNREWDTQTWVGSPAKLEREVGWRMRTSFSMGLAKTIDWFNNNRQWLRFYEQLLQSRPGSLN